MYVMPNLAVMSVGFMLENEDQAVIWRGPKKNGLIKQFLRDVEWDNLGRTIVFFLLSFASTFSCPALSQRFSCGRYATRNVR